MEIMHFFSDLTIISGADNNRHSKVNYITGYGYDDTIITESQLGRKAIFTSPPKIILIDICLDFNYYFMEKFDFHNKRKKYIKFFERYNH